jgi:hypothetical protein
MMAMMLEKMMVMICVLKGKHEKEEEPLEI